MDVDSIASAFVAAQASRMQLAVAAKLLRMDANAATGAAKLLDAASHNLDRLANVAAGIGTGVDLSV